MKKLLLTSAAILAALTTNALALVEVTITGATAFRAAANEAILKAYEGSTGFGYAYIGNPDTFSGSTFAYFTGFIPSFNDTVVVRTSWTGSTEGIRDVVEQNGVTVLVTPPVDGDGQNHVSGTVPTTTMVPDMCFSDVQPVATPQGGDTLSGGPVGVIVFVAIANQGAPFTNVTQQQLAKIQELGDLPLSFFTGLDSDDNKKVLWTGRNDGSGTRGYYLAESGYGYTSLVKQFKIASTTGAESTSNMNITKLLFWPANDTADTRNNSTLWYESLTAGNGGYFSGSELRDRMGATTTGTSVVLNFLGSEFPYFPDPQPEAVYLMSVVGLADARTAIGNGATLLTYNGVGVTPVSTGLSLADQAKIQNGNYSLWSFENFFYRTGIDQEKIDFYDDIVAQLPTEIPESNAGISLPDMGDTSRPADGAPIVP